MFFASEKFWGSFVLAALIGLFMTFVDPWRLGSAANLTSAEIALSVAAPLYKVVYPSAETVQNKIGMVLIDDATVRELGDRFPIDRVKLSTFVNSLVFGNDPVDPAAGATVIGQARPHMMHFNLLFADQREDLSTLRKRLNWLARGSFRLRENDDLVETFAAVSTPVQRWRPGVLVSDLQSVEPQAANTYVGPQKIDPLGGANRRSLRSQIALESAPSLVTAPMLRYAIAPDGQVAAAFVLAFWACASMKDQKFAGCPSLLHKPSLGEVARASRAAAQHSLLAECREGVQRKGIADHATLIEFCEDVALRFAVNAGWAPDPAKFTDEPHANRLAQIRRAARDGRLRAAIDFGEHDCFERLRKEPIVRGRRMEPSSPVTVWMDCARERGADLEGAMIGTVAAVMWGAGPDDGGGRIFFGDSTPGISGDRRVARTGRRAGLWQHEVFDGHDCIALLKDDPDGAPQACRNLIETDSAPNGGDTAAAPYVWAHGEGEAGLIGDHCRAFRYDPRDAVSVIGQMARRFLSPMHPQGDNFIDPCPYHRQVSGNWFASSNLATRSFVHSTMDDRIVLLGASVSVSPDIFPARRIAAAPGLWSHAMMLDNLLTRPSGYTPATTGEAGFLNTTVHGKLKVWALELSLTALALFVFAALSIRQTLSDPLCRLFGLDPDRGLMPHLIHVLAGGVVSTFLLITIAVLLLFMVPAIPPVDWISAAALASGSYATFANAR